MLKAVGIVVAILSPLLLSLVDVGQRDAVPGNTNVFIVFGLLLVAGIVAGVLIGERWALIVVPIAYLAATVLWRPVTCTDCAGLTDDGVGGLIISAFIAVVLVVVGVATGLIIRMALAR